MNTCTCMYTHKICTYMYITNDLKSGLHNWNTVLLDKDHRCQALVWFQTPQPSPGVWVTRPASGMQSLGTCCTCKKNYRSEKYIQYGWTRKRLEDYGKRYRYLECTCTCMYTCILLWYVSQQLCQPLRSTGTHTALVYNIVSNVICIADWLPDPSVKLWVVWTLPA